MFQSIINLKKSKNLIYNIILLIVFIIFCICEVYNRVLPQELILISYVLVITFLIVGLLSFNKWSKIFLAFIILCFGLGQFYIQNSVDRIIANYNYDSFETLIVVKKESPYLRIEQLENKNIFVSPNLQPVIFEDNMNKLKESIHNFNLVKDHNDLVSANMLLSGQIDALMLSSSSLSFIEEEKPDFKDNYRIIDKFLFHKERQIKAKPVVDISQPFTVFVSGIDVTGPITTVSRSDVNIVMSINPQTRKIVTVSVPRDTYIPLPCMGNQLDKLTHAGNHGVECSIDSVSKFLGIDIHYYVRVNFTSVLEIVHLFDSLDVNSHYDFIGFEGTHFSKGINHLTPKQVLELARTRKTVPGGDITRGKHQQEVIKSLFKQILSPNSVFKLESVISNISKSIDTNFDSNKLSSLIAQQLSDPSDWGFDSYAIDADGAMAYVASYSASPLSVMIPYEDSIKTGINKLRENLELELIDKVPYVPHVDK